MDPYLNFDHIDVFTSGAIGEPGQRVFYLQVRSGPEVVTIRCEKQQVATISAYLRRALADLPVPEGQPPRELMRLTEPFDEEFILGAVALEFSTSADHFVLYLKELTPTDINAADINAVPDDLEDIDFESDDDDSLDEEIEDVTEGARVRLGLTAAQAMAFCENSDRLVAAGRPTCVYCERPIEADGHFCPRMN